MLAIGSWAALISFLYFIALKALNRFRVNSMYEVVGLDLLMHSSLEDIVQSGKNAAIKERILLDWENTSELFEDFFIDDKVKRKSRMEDTEIMGLLQND